MQLRVIFTNRVGFVLGEAKQFSGLQVTEPLNDSVTGQFTISMFDPMAEHVVPLKNMVKVLYGPRNAQQIGEDYLLAWAYLLNPTFNYAAGTIEVTFHDPSLKLKHHYFQYGDEAVSDAYPLDGRGIRTMIDAAVPSAEEQASGVPSHGIAWGDDTTTHTGPKPANLADPQDTDGSWRKVERGSGVFEGIQNLTQVLGGPDFYLRPVDEEHDGSAGLEVFCRLDTFDRRGTDKRDSIRFEHNFGRDSASDIQHNPDGDAVRNYMVEVSPGGQSDEGDTGHVAVVTDDVSLLEFGIMEGWESSGQGDSVKLLRLKARAYLGAYAYPPDYFTITPAQDRDGVPVFKRDYDVGDVVTGSAKKGYCAVDIVGRITSARLTQVDAASNTKVELDCVPKVELATDTPPSDGGGGDTGNGHTDQ